MWTRTSLVLLSVAAVSTLSLYQPGLNPPAVVRRSDGSYTYSYQTPSSSHYASQGRLSTRHSLDGQDPRFTIGQSAVRSPILNNVPDTQSSAASSRSLSVAQLLAPRNAQASLSSVFANTATGRFYFDSGDGIKRTVRYEPPSGPVAKKLNSIANPNGFISTRRTHFPAVYREQANTVFAPQMIRIVPVSSVFTPSKPAVKEQRTPQTSSRLAKSRRNEFKLDVSSEENDDDDDNNSNESSEILPEILSKFISNKGNVEMKTVELNDDAKVVHLNQGKNSGIWGYSFSSLYQ